MWRFCFSKWIKFTITCNLFLKVFFGYGDIDFTLAKEMIGKEIYFYISSLLRWLNDSIVCHRKLCIRCSLRYKMKLFETFCVYFNYIKLLFAFNLGVAALCNIFRETNSSIYGCLSMNELK